MMKFIWFFLLIVSSTTYGNVHALQHVPKRDQLYMKRFFDEAIKSDQAGHVILCNSKPACLIGLVLSDPVTRRDKFCLKGWRAFRQYEHLFPHPEFIFNETQVQFAQDCKVLHIYLLNKPVLLACLNQYLDLFKQTLGSDFTPNSFIISLEHGESLPDLLDHNEMLLGIILGYGPESSKAYQEVDNLPELPPESPNYCSIETKSPPKCKISPVTFMGNPNLLEVRKLISSYENELDLIWRNYKGRDSLELFIQCICKHK